MSCEFVSDVAGSMVDRQRCTNAYHRRPLGSLLLATLATLSCAERSLPSIASATPTVGTTGSEVVVTGSSTTTTGSTGGSVSTGTGSSTGSSSSGTSSGGTSPPGTSTGASTTGSGTTAGGPLLLSDFNAQSASAAGGGTFEAFGGGSNNDENQTLVFNAQGPSGQPNDYAAELRYTTDSGTYSYSQIDLLFNSGSVLQNYQHVSFDMRGTGSGTVLIAIVSALSTAANNYATYGVGLDGAAPASWMTFTCSLDDFIEIGNPNFTLQQAISPANFQGFKWNVGKGVPSGQTENGTLLLDNIYLQP